eukprot:CAMPEP_0197557434 /NCGR_PEP_ID=MMETSP1320-20131121/17134_1 /TAXON_ID=91990 /ORGANISM="Bolidomonas sp., Strain RCC2347" /LENGTH=195 /DNA_ID=CAMNT_0043118671 /DNA_START=197 /DNA_END=780 /DNA_ORIENTATION=-
MSFKFPSPSQLLDQTKQKAVLLKSALTSTAGAKTSPSPPPPSKHDDASASTSAQSSSLASSKETLSQIKARRALALSSGKCVAVGFDPPGLPLLSLLRGPYCSKCSERAYLLARSSGLHPPIRGLNSTWITPDLMASSRPSDAVVSSYGVCKQMNKQGVTMVLNLCQPGEHPHCGPSFDAMTGHSYDFEAFHEAG